MPAECKEMGTDITQISDLDQSQVEQTVSEVENTNLEVLMGIRDGIFDDVHRNIKTAQKDRKRIMTKGTEMETGQQVQWQKPLGKSTDNIHGNVTESVSQLKTKKKQNRRRRGQENDTVFDEKQVVPSQQKTME